MVDTKGRSKNKWRPQALDTVVSRPHIKNTVIGFFIFKFCKKFVFHNRSDIKKELRSNKKC